MYLPYVQTYNIAIHILLPMPEIANTSKYLLLPMPKNATTPKRMLLRGAGFEQLGKNVPS